MSARRRRYRERVELADELGDQERPGGPPEGGTFSVTNEITVRPCGTTGSGESGSEPSADAEAEKQRAKQEAKRRAKRTQRYGLREVLWEESRDKRLRCCGRVPGRRAGGTKGTPEIRINGEGAAFYGDVARCGSVWACPVCSAKIRHERAMEADRAMTGWLDGTAPGAPAGGGSVLFLTTTLPHDLGDSLDALFDAIGKAWSRMFSGRPWRRDRERWAFSDWFRASDVTEGSRNGWHPHFHAVVFSERTDLGPAELEEIREQLHGRWSAAIERAGFRRPSREHGIRVELAETPENLASYVLKVAGEQTGTNVANELTRGDLKTGKGRTPFQILEDFARTGDLEDLERWHEWERASKGRHFSQWSRGARAALGIDERSDEEIVAEPEEGARTVYRPTADEWHAIVATPGAMARALDVAEREGTLGVKRWVRRIEEQWRSKRRHRRRRVG